MRQALSETYPIRLLRQNTRVPRLILTSSCSQGSLEQEAVLFAGTETNQYNGLGKRMLTVYGTLDRAKRAYF